MAQRAGKKRMTLSEHLALRAKAVEDSKAQEEARRHRIQNLKALDAMAMCTCPACVRLRQLNNGE